MCSKGMMQTSASSSATALQVWWSPTMPSSPMISPAIWNPVTCSWPFSVDTVVLNVPVRMAKSDWKGAPRPNSTSPLARRLRPATSVSSLIISSRSMPTGMHSSRRLQFEQATLKASGFMAVSVLC